MTEKQDVKTALTNAQRLHGHLGPFLTIGVKMGTIINRTLLENAETRITLKVPNEIPYTCVIDGLQTTTHCTVGNQKLIVQSSSCEITATATTKNPHQKVTLTTKKEVIEKLITQIRNGVKLEELAQEIVEASEKELFSIRSYAEEKTMNDLDIAKTTLIKEKLTLVVAKNETIIYKTNTRGVTGFLQAIERFGNDLTHASVADKVVGKASALLCLHAKIRALYARTLSKKAKESLEKTEISIEFDKLIDNILSPDKKNICPFEKAVADISDPNLAYTKLNSMCKLKESKQSM
jgi:formylmethanofuran dehydrogenase subunit E